MKSSERGPEKPGDWEKSRQQTDSSIPQPAGPGQPQAFQPKTAQPGGVGDDPSQGYRGFQTGQPGDYRSQERGQFFGVGSHETADQPSGGYGSYGAYQVGTLPETPMAAGVAKDEVDVDERLRETIRIALADHHAVDVSGVNIQVQGGRVVLEGTVPMRAMKHQIEEVIDSCWGVKDVDNRIRIQPPGGEHPGQVDLNNPVASWLAVPADIITRGASTEAETGGAGTSETDMSPLETGSAAKGKT